MSLCHTTQKKLKAAIHNTYVFMQQTIGNKQLVRMTWYGMLLHWLRMASRFTTFCWGNSGICHSAIRLTHLVPVLFNSFTQTRFVFEFNIHTCSTWAALALKPSREQHSYHRQRTRRKLYHL